MYESSDANRISTACYKNSFIFALITNIVNPPITDLLFLLPGTSKYGGVMMESAHGYILIFVIN
jgi:hypothetical protein